MNSIARLLFIFIVLLFPIKLFCQTEITALELGKPIENQLKGGEVHTYKINLAAGQFLHVIAEQKGIDVVISFFAPDGKKLLEVDSPNGSQGPEPLWFLAQTAGDYRLELGSLEKGTKAGHYVISVKELRAGTTDDELFAEGKKLVSESSAILAARKPDSVVKSAEKIEEAAALFQKMEDIKRKASGLSEVAQLYFRFRQFEKAILYWKEAAELFEKAGLMKEAVLDYVNLGVSYGWLYLNEKSFNAYRKALSISEITNDKDDQAMALGNIGNLHRELGDYDSALPEYGRSLKISEEIGNNAKILTNLNNLGIVYWRMGNHVRALELFHKYQTLQKATGIKGSEISVLVNIGNVYSDQGNLKLALQYYQDALVKFRAGGFSTGESAALGNIGNIYFRHGEYAEGIKYYEQSRQIRERSKLPLTVTMFNIGKAHKLHGKLDEAEQYFVKALEWSERTAHTMLKADSYRELAEIYLLQGNLDKAAEFVSKASSLSQERGFLNIYGQSLIINAKINLRHGKTKEAVDALQTAVNIIESIRRSGGEVGETGFLVIEPFQMLVNIFVSEGKFADAFSYGERIKARTLLDLLHNTRKDVKKLLSNTERETEQKLKYELVSLNSQISRENQRQQPNIALLADLQNQLEKKRLEFEDFQTRLYAAHPELRIQRGEMKPVSLEESAKLLPDDKSALLEYVISDDKAFLFVLTKEAKQSQASLKVYPIEVKQKDLAERTESFRLKLAKGDLDFSKQAQDLYNLLLKPAEAQIKNKTNLIIVPDSVLWDLPFQALQPAQNKYLIETKAVAYAPSLTALREMRKKNQSRQFSNATLLAFGNPSVGKETSDRVKQVFMSEKLEPLPDAERLVNSLQKMYGTGRSKVFVGAEASEEIAKTESPKYRIVQFAAHGILNDASPMYSHIVLAQKQDNPNEDGLLEAWEMKDLDLNADMVILSACETARGRFGSGEGVIGMSWALFIAGAPTTVASQWKVESSSTTELMLEFHRQLLTSKGISKAEALRRASLKLLKTPKYKHPSYWAGFVIVGDGF